jgi:translation initiation factor 5B
VVYGKKKKPPGKPFADKVVTEVPVEVPVVEEVKVETPGPIEAASTETEAVRDPIAEVEAPDAWDASEEDVPDAWDASDDGEDKVEPAPVIVKKVQTPSPVLKEAVRPVVQPATKAVEVSKTNPAAKKAETAKKPATKNAAKVESESEKSSDDDDSDSESSEDSDSDSSDDELSVAQKMAAHRKAEAAKRREERVAQAMAARSKDDMRSPICCILGHVDTGKTKLLDKIRQTNVQEGEAGGITQQIGATYFPIEAVIEKTQMLREKGEDHGYNLPGLLVIDTPGHESFTNLRSRGSSLCNIAVLVVDIVHGLEPQTIESLNLLRDRKTPFIVALNKIDRLFDWETHANYPTRTTLAMQKKHVVKEFHDRVTKTIVEFAEQGLNACLYWDNKNVGRNVSLVPTSAITGEGIPDLLHLLIDLTQTRMTERLMYLSELECTVLEVKVIEGLGTTIDVVLSNGVLNEGDRICVCGLNGPIVTTIRALLTPQPMRELRVKSAYVHHKQVKASLGIKIAAPDLEKAVAGARLMVITPDDDEDDIKEVVMGDLQNLLTSIDKSGKGVCVQASTLGSLEALLSFLASSKIPVSGINIGPGTFYLTQFTRKT